MKKLNLYLFVLLIIGGCSFFLPKNSKKNDKQIYLLTNDSVKYWCYIENKSSLNSEKSGIALYKNGVFILYGYYNGNKRIFDLGSEDIICDTSKFNINSNKLYVEECGYTFVFKIEKLTSNSLKLKEITNYGFYPNDISPHFIISKDQKSKPIIDSTDYSNSGPFYLVPK